MKESVSEELIHLGINFGFTLFFFVISCALVTCIINCYSGHDNHHDDEHDNNNNNDHVIITIRDCTGIKPSVLRSIPVLDFNSQDFKNGVECVVCLSELADGDKARVLPSCNHCFHADCIDSWFRTHSTCPICRKRVDSVHRGTRPQLGGNDPRSEHPQFPTDPLPRTDPAVDCGEANEVGSYFTAAGVVDIPVDELDSRNKILTSI